MDSIIVTTNSSIRSTDIGELEKIAIEIFGHDRVFAHEKLSDALDKAIKDAIRPLSDETIGILVTGSVVTAGDARKILRKKFAKVEK